MHTIDFPGIPLATTMVSSAWDVYDTMDGVCHWESYGLASCFDEPQPISHWILTNKQSSFPNGPYKHVNHSASCSFLNYDWHRPELPTGTYHTITITRYPGVTQTVLGLSYHSTGEDTLLLDFTVSDGGANNCN
jgi:hypothetical protein